MTNFKMDFNCTLNGLTYEIEDDYLFKVVDTERVSKHKLTDNLISELEEIKEKYDYNDVNRVYLTSKIINTEYGPDFWGNLEN